MCTINDNHIMYGSWDMEGDGQNFLSFIIILHKCTKNYDHTLHYFWDTIHDRCNFYFSSWAIFYPFPPLKTQKIFKKKKKNFWRYHNFTHVHHKKWSHDVSHLIRKSASLLSLKNLFIYSTKLLKKPDYITVTLTTTRTQWYHWK